MLFGSLAMRNVLGVSRDEGTPPDCTARVFAVSLTRNRPSLARFESQSVLQDRLRSAGFDSRRQRPTTSSKGTADMLSFVPDSSVVSTVTPSPNYGDRKGLLSPNMIVLHYTGMADAASAIVRLCTEGTEVSAHYCRA